MRILWSSPVEEVEENLVRPAFDGASKSMGRMVEAVVSCVHCEEVASFGALLVDLLPLSAALSLAMSTYFAILSLWSLLYARS